MNHLSFRTEIGKITTPFQIQIKKPIFSIGSCFANEIGNLLKINKFDIQVNPFGTIFNPISIFKLLAYSLKPETLDISKIVHHQELFFHLDFHSDFWAESSEELEKKLLLALQNAQIFLRKEPILIFTFGTAWVYEYENQTVANCHQLPNHLFNKRLLSVQEIVESFKKLTNQIPNLPIILTLSPVRHLKDTIELNQVSKSVLRLACYEICQQFSNVAYFPSYEIVMDDLRDYRFYGEDFIHPNEIAISYIWKHFSTVFFDEETQKFLHQWEKIYKSLQHKAFRPDAENHQKFLKKLLQDLEKIKKVDVSSEIAWVKSQIL